MVTKKLFLCFLCLLMVPAAALAGGKNTDSCAALGSLAIKCYDCGPEKKYLGKAAVIPAYEEDQGGKFCVPTERGKRVCSSRFGVPADRIGFYAKHWIALTSYEEFYNSSCVKSIGY